MTEGTVSIIRDTVAAGTARLRVSPLQTGALLALAIGIAYVFTVNRFVPVDAYGYLAAGERINAGHALYALSQGDRTMLPSMQSYAFLYPPTIAVLWLPMAALGEWTILPWWGLAIALTVGVALALVLYRPVSGSIAILILFPAFAFLALLGSVNALILAAGWAAWYKGLATRWNAAAFLLGFMTTVKPITLPLLVWAAVRGRPPLRSLPGASAGVVLGLAIGLLAGGPDVYLQWLSVAAQNADVPHTSLSPSHLAPLLPFLVLTAGSVLALMHPTRPAFVAAVVATAVGHPTANLGSLSLLALIALAVESSGSSLRRPNVIGAHDGRASEH
jgi:hypothetical protein